MVWMTVIFIGSTDVLSAEHTSRFLVPFLRWLDPQISLATIASINAVMRKFGHFFEYAILSALLWRALRATLRSSFNVRPAAVALVISALFAASDEFHQSFVPSRTPSGNDVLIDICGAGVAVAVCQLVRRRSSAEPGANLQSKI